MNSTARSDYFAGCTESPRMVTGVLLPNTGRTLAEIVQAPCYCLSCDERRLKAEQLQW